MKKKIISRGIITFLLTLVLIIGAGVSNVFAATVGQALTAPEAGWQRIDDNSPNISFVGYTYNSSMTNYYNSTLHYGTNGFAVSFSFYGTKLRVISPIHPSFSNNINITIDGVTENFSTQYDVQGAQITLAFEKAGLAYGKHNVSIINNSSYNYYFDAIDIDSGGSMNNITPPTISGTAGNGKVDLSWNSIAEATSYNVKRSTTSGGPYTPIATGLTTTIYPDTSVTTGTTYFYVVTTVNSSGESAISNEVSVTPYAVTPPTVVATPGNAKVDLSWNSIAEATSYNVKRSTASGGPYTPIATGVTTTIYPDTNVAFGTTYYYVVTAVNDSGESMNSNEVSGTPYEVPPPIDPGEFTGNKAILEITMTNGKIKEYDLSITDINAFLTWYDNKSNGTGKAYYAIKKTSNIKPFLGRKEYIIFDKIQDFEIKDYNE